MIGDCPKCGDRMLVLFQTPKCERCELGGRRVKQAVCSKGEPLFRAVDIDALRGADVCDAAVYATEEKVKEDHWKTKLRLVVVKP